ncbi:MAG TPA: TonB-dependent receptor [Bryobacteraceae bacterium]|nr:TonB-dependent receptor [Bryobacteraceae bacterium]
MSKHFTILLLASFFTLVFQAFSAPVGAIRGYVRDASGAAVPNAILTLTNQRTGVEVKTISDGEGFYQFLNLDPSVYQLSSSSPGFGATEVKDITVLVDQIVSLDLQLQVGQLTQSVEVSSTSEVLQTENGSTGTNITSQQVSNLPLVNRRFNDLALLTPGATFAAAGTQAGSFAAAGTRAQSTNWQLDGVNAIDPNVNGPTQSYRIAEAIQEFSVLTTGYSAEFGRASGAEVNVVTKSGTNQFHGSLFEFSRNDAFQANSFFTNKLNGTKNLLRHNQYGGTVGGPIKRDKTFFFYSYERYDETASTPTTAIVPTAAQRASVLDPIARNLLAYYPLPTLPNAAAGTTNYVGNVPAITKDNTHLIRIDHTFSDKDHLTGRYIDYFGNTFSGGSLPTTGGVYNVPNQQNAVLSEVHTFSPTFLSEVRLGFSRNKTNFTTQDSNLNAATVLAGVPGVVNATVNAKDAGLPTITFADGYAQLGSNSNYPQGRRSNTYEIYFNNSKTITAGLSQTLKFGYYGRREETWRFLDGDNRGVLSFNNFADFAGTCLTCAGASQIYSSSVNTGDTLGHWYRYPHAFYIQDDIKVRSNLTVNIGLRYEIPSVLSEKRNKGTNFVEGVGPVLLGTDLVLGIDPNKVGPAAFTYTPGPVRLSNAGVNPDYTDFSPTFGFAYTPHGDYGPFGSGKTVIRGGFRIGYDDLFNNIPINQTSNAPFSLITTQTAGVTQPGLFGWNLAFNQNVPLLARATQAPGAPAVGLVSFTGEATNAKSAYAENFNFTVQQQIARGSSIEVSYIGTEGHRLGVYLDANQPYVTVNNPAVRGSQAPNEQFFPYPTWASSQVAQFIGNSTYNGLVVSGKWQIGDRLSMAGSYTWSHGIDDTSSFFGNTLGTGLPANSRDLALDRGNSANDQRHRFFHTFVYQLPIGKGQRFFAGIPAWANEVIGGWSVTGITNLATGQPFTILANPSIDYSGFNQFVDRPNIAGAGTLTLNTGNPDDFFNRKYFGTAPTGTVGNLARNAYYGPGLIDFDTTLSKRFAIKERAAFELRGDFFNVLNHTNFALTSSNRTESSGQFGLLSAVSTFNGGSTGGPRVIQITGRFTF